MNDPLLMLVEEAVAISSIVAGAGAYFGKLQFLTSTGLFTNFVI